jgi:cytochrome b6-f complex iron-sulfur subunit
MNVGRRSVMKAIFGSALGLGLLALGTAAGLWAAAIARFLRPNVSSQPPGTFRAGTAGDYADGCVEGKYRQRHGVWVVGASHGSQRIIYVLRATCTHLGCITVWQESRQRFQCPCHGSAFTKAGLNIEGPAPRPLERCAIRVADDGQLEIDCGRTFQQQLGQWDDPESYVEV